MINLFYALYDTENNGICVGVFDTLKELGDYAGITESGACDAVNSNHLIQTRYRAKRIEEE